MRLLPLLTGLVLASTLFAGPADAADPTTLRIGFAPFENQDAVLRKATPIVKSLSKSLGLKVIPFVAGDYPGVVEAMKGGKLDVAFFSPAALVMAEKVAGARVLLKSVYKGRSHYFSAIITRTDSNIHSLKDLKGRNFAFVDPASTTGSVYPKLMIMNAGLDPARDLGRIIYAGGHDAAVLAVYNRKVDAAATFANDNQGIDVPWKKMLKGDAGAIRALAYSKPIPNGAIAVSRHLSAPLVKRIRQAFLDMGKQEAGRKNLAQMYLMDEFLPTTSAEYDQVREAFTKVGLSL